ncbi:MAG TPA: metal ABC transporter ATP-binding protein [Acidimicrobiia bacterium]|nr:metal ABC transporter ATP-binding protein [Acidimicrobiia bacterium]
MRLAVEARDVVLRYGQRVALAASSFPIPAGSFTAIIGPNGSGKSTVLNAVAGLVPLAAGSLEVRAGPIAYVLQSTKVNEALHVTVSEVVTMGRYASTGAYGRLRGEDRDSVAAAMRRLDITGLADRHLHELSGGQRQRVFVAQGIAQDHEMLLLDEPLTGLDITSAHAIDEMIHEEQEAGRTVIMTTHDLAEARTADWVLLLSGRVVASGVPEEVLTLGNLAEAYGPSLLHVHEDGFFLDDPAHQPVPGRHQTERTIHAEPPSADEHG